MRPWNGKEIFVNLQKQPQLFLKNDNDIMEHFRIVHGDMFSKYDSGSLSRSRDKQVSDAIARLSDDYVLNVNEEDYIQYLIDEYTLYMPVIHFDDVRIETRKVLVDPEYLPRYWGAQKAIERTMVRYIIPISGNSNLLYFCPSSFLISGSGNFHVISNEIYTDILAINDDAEQVKREYESAKDSCMKMLGFLEKDVCAYNNGLPQTARDYFISRKERIKRENSFVVNLGVPTSSQVKNPKTYAVPTVSHRFVPPKAKSTTKEVEAITPVMDMAKYEQILEALQTVGQMYEKLPKVTQGMDEETLRDLFLAQIQTSFKSDSATAEAFNKNGKTDIMVKHGEGVLFVAECKFWKGKQVLHDAISQLLSYLTWRDTKAALLIFVRDTTMTTAVKGVKENISSHENYKSTSGPKGETWFNFKFTLPNDSDREIYLAVQIFDFNTTK